MGIKRAYLSSLKHKALYTAGAIMFGLFLFYICTRPHSVIERWHYPDISDLFDAANHFIGFTIFNFLLISALSAGRATLSDPRHGHAKHGYAAALLLAVGLPWGFLCEFVQLFIPSRSFQLIDMGANTLPSLLVFFIFKYTKL